MRLGQRLASIFKEDNKMAMTKTANWLKTRMDKLHKKDPIMNKNIVNKLQRKIRNLEGQE